MHKSVIVIIVITIITTAVIAGSPLTAEQSVNNVHDVQADSHGVSSEVHASQSTSCANSDTCPPTLEYMLANKAPLSTSSDQTLSVSGEVAAPSEDAVEDVEQTPEASIAVVEDTLPEPEVDVAVEIVVEPIIAEPVVIAAIEVEDTSAADFMSVLAAEIHRLTNIERARAGLSALTYDKELEVIAGHHSDDMAQNDYFSHTAAGDCDLACRYKKAEYDAQAWGENIAWRSANPLPEATELAAFFVEEWMNSPGHRRNILSSSFTYEGVGLSRIGNKVYATVNFSRSQ